MKLFKISQCVNDNYDTYDEAIVCAESEEEARKIHPDGGYDYKETGEGEFSEANSNYGTWAKKEYVDVKYIGEAMPLMKRGVVCASFNAG